MKKLFSIVSPATFHLALRSLITLGSFLFIAKFLEVILKRVRTPQEASGLGLGFRVRVASGPYFKSAYVSKILLSFLQSSDTKLTLIQCFFQWKISLLMLTAEA